MGVIDFNKVIAYSKNMCVKKSIGRCATYVKKAFEKGGCKYIVGNGWNNQKWCKENGFVCIGDFVPEDKNPRPHSGKGIQFPSGYVQQVGDVCLIKHGIYGHICYATGPGLNDWVSDFFQRPPVQLDGMGPYCYSGNYERIQFWRHTSVLNNTPRIDDNNLYASNDVVDTSNNFNKVDQSAPSNNVIHLSSVSNFKEKIINIDDVRKKEFEALRNTMISNSKQMGRDILVTSELYDSNILKGTQESKTERV